MLGVGMALVFLITFAVLATQLLKVTGLVFAGGLLLLWVAYNMWRGAPSEPAGRSPTILTRRRSKDRRARRPFFRRRSRSRSPT